MGQAVYITDPVVAAAYRVHPGEFADIADDLEAAWLMANRHAFSLNQRSALPAAYYVDVNAPLPFVPYVEIGNGADGDGDLVVTPQRQAAT
jgi:hypothetical protein